MHIAYLGHARAPRSFPARMCSTIDSFHSLLYLARCCLLQQYSVHSFFKTPPEELCKEVVGSAMNRAGDIAEFFMSISKVSRTGAVIPRGCGRSFHGICARKKELLDSTAGTHRLYLCM